YDSKVEKILVDLLHYFEPLKNVEVPKQSSHRASPQKKEEENGAWLFIANLFENLFNRRTVNIDLSQHKINVVYAQQPRKTDSQRDEEEEKKAKEKEDKQTTAIAVISGLIALGGCYFLGSSTSESKNLESIGHDLSDLETFIEKTKIQQRQSSNFKIDDSKKQVLNLQIDLLDRIKSTKAYTILCRYANTAFKVKAFIIGSLLFTTISALFKAKQLMKCGGIFLLCGLGLWLFNKGQKNSDKMLERAKKELVTDIEAALAIFQSLPKEVLNQSVFYYRRQQPAFFEDPNFSFWASQAYTPQYSSQHGNPYSNASAPHVIY
ncbi:MAG TPA: hypothetical protein PLC42_03055, partial [Parachlamydiaceae bacterium]|nr:hypothetical protein [Parachlamydiaceae bacterium]